MWSLSCGHEPLLSAGQHPNPCSHQGSQEPNLLTKQLQLPTPREQETLSAVLTPGLE